MLSLPDRASVERAIARLDDWHLAHLLAERLALSIANGVADMTHYLVLHYDDTERDIVHEVSFSPLANPTDNARFPDSAFQPWWDWLADLGGWFEMFVSIGNSGFAVILLIEDRPGSESAILDLCRRYSE